MSIPSSKCLIAARDVSLGSTIASRQTLFIGRELSEDFLVVPRATLITDHCLRPAHTGRFEVRTIRCGHRTTAQSRPEPSTVATRTWPERPGPAWCNRPGWRRPEWAT